MEFKIVIKPKSNLIEKSLFIILILFIFIPFIIGLYSNNYKLSLSLPIGFILIFLFNFFTNGKFQYRNWIQENTIKFTDSELLYKTKSSTEKFNLTEIKKFQIKLVGYDGERAGRGHIDRPTILNGTENWIRFELNSKPYHYDFYLNSKKMKWDLISIINKELCNQIINGKITILIRGRTGFKTCDLRELKKVKIPNS